MLSVEVMIATMNRSEPPNVLALLDESGDRPALLAINQCTTQERLPDQLQPGVRMLSFAERGLSRSRNRALDNCRSDIGVIGDDDVTYLPNIVNTIRRAFTAFPDAAAVTFQYLESGSRAPIKQYGGTSFRHSPRSIASVSSIEIALCPVRIQGVRFDERFGLGTDLPIGEEGIFLSDLLKKGLSAYYWPEPICLHAGSGTGYLKWDLDTAFAKGAVFRRMYPRMWPAAALYFALAKHRDYARGIGFTTWLKTSLRGALKRPD